MSSPRSKLPSPRLAMTKEASTIVWPWAARASGPPRSEGPMAKPMGSQRAFMSIPAVIAATAPPPAARTLRAANWAAPEKTKIDMAIGATGPMTGRARTPKDTPRASVGSTSGSPARTPALTLLCSCIWATLPVYGCKW